MVEVFKTDISKKKVARMLVNSLAIQFPKYKINIDFTDCDKVLRIESERPSDPNSPDGYRDRDRIEVDQIVRFVKSQNVMIELLP